jgi:hypothetical protein
MIRNVAGVIQCVLLTLTQTAAWVCWLCWHQEDQITPRSRIIVDFEKTEVKGPKCSNSNLVRTSHTFSKPQHWKFQRPVCGVQVRHLGSLRVLLGFPRGGGALHGLNGGLGFPDFWQVAVAVAKATSNPKLQVLSFLWQGKGVCLCCCFCMMRLRASCVCVCLFFGLWSSFKFGTGGLLVLTHNTNARILFFVMVMLRRCLSDFTIRQQINVDYGT